MTEMYGLTTMNHDHERNVVEVRNGPRYLYYCVIGPLGMYEIHFGYGIFLDNNALEIAHTGNIGVLSIASSKPAPTVYYRQIGDGTRELAALADESAKLAIDTA